MTEVDEEGPPAGLTGPVGLTGRGGADGTGLVLLPVAGQLARIGWLGPAIDGLDPAEVAGTVGVGGPAPSVHESTGRSVPVLPQVSAGWHGQPGLRGYRIASGSTGADWSPAFGRCLVSGDARALTVQAGDAERGLSLRTEIQPAPGGALRIRHTLTNDAAEPYVVDGLDVIVPVPDRVAEILDLTGRWGRERSPQRHPVRDGVWLREGRTGRPGPESATVLCLGTAGFGFGHGEVWGVHLAWSGNSRHFVERLPSGLTVFGAGELLLPGEVVLAQGESYASPWVFFAASASGLDGLAAQFHQYLRAQPAHPVGPRPVVCNVWEAVYFDHDLGRLSELAELAVGIGIDRFVLDDGWFSSRRDDRSGLGDWTVSEQAWPDGLAPIIDRVRGLGMRFGLWFEPEMVNADSELYRAHPGWVLAVPGRPAQECLRQRVFDLGQPAVRQDLFDQLDAGLAAHASDFVKWDHNRPLADGASGARAGAAGVHAQTLGFYDLLDRLRAAHPGVEWESCASGGARIDLGVLQRCQRVWTSDMTDALSRQLIQRWTAQLVPPEYLGAHVSAPANHQTGRQLSLDFRAATAFFGDLGVEWDISRATPAERNRLAGWIALYKQHRALLHGGRLVRVDSPEDAHWIHGVLAHDRSEAVMAYVQLDETVHDPGPLLVPGLAPQRQYLARRLLPDTGPAGDLSDGVGDLSDSVGDWPGEGCRLSGAALATIGLPAPGRRPLSALIVHLSAL
ncbi:MAG: alpha-galactosidase [Jatrophihabitans sp.]